MQFLKSIDAIGRDETAAAAIEYGLIAALIGLAALGAIGGVADENTKKWKYVEKNVVQASEAPQPLGPS